LEGSAEQRDESADDKDRDEGPMDDVEDARGVASKAADEEEQRELGAIDAKIEDGLADCERLWKSVHDIEHVAVQIGVLFPKSLSDDLQKLQSDAGVDSRCKRLYCAVCKTKDVRAYQV
jgi:hypothetical protein